MTTTSALEWLDASFEQPAGASGRCAPGLITGTARQVRPMIHAQKRSWTPARRCASALRDYDDPDRWWL